MIDNSALNRAGVDAVRERLEPLLIERLVATCAVLNLEALYSATSPAHYESLRTQRDTSFVYIETTESAMQAALDCQAILAAASQHRGCRVPDLMIAGIALENGLTVLHYDSDFERLAEHTELQAEWVVPRGSIE